MRKQTEDFKSMNKQPKLSAAQQRLLAECGDGKRHFCIDTYKPALKLREFGLIRLLPRQFGFGIEITEEGRAALLGIGSAK